MSERGVGRPTKFNQERAAQIVDRLRAGGTRRAASESVGISVPTFLSWLERGTQAQSGPFVEFLHAVTRAEAEAELRNITLLEKAANGWDAGSTTRTTKTVFRTRKTVHKDGRVVEEPVALQETTESVTTEREFDWRAALEWLKRRRREDWGDQISVTMLEQFARQLEKMSDADLLRSLGYADDGAAPAAGSPMASDAEGSRGPSGDTA